MKERPILFTAPMVRAILADRKTQTRRIAKDVRHPDLGGWYSPGALALEPHHVIDRACPHGGFGDRLWVRESFRFAASLDRYAPNDVGEKALDAGYSTPWAPTQFEADGGRAGAWQYFDTPPTITEPGKLRPGIHMPRWASRTTLGIAAVRLERLQDISDEDARAEGCDPWHDLRGVPNVTVGEMAHGYRRAFYELWKQINGPESWAANPWVWVIEFRDLGTDKKEK